MLSGTRRAPTASSSRIGEILKFRRVSPTPASFQPPRLQSIPETQRYDTQRCLNTLEMSSDVQVQGLYFFQNRLARFGLCALHVARRTTLRHDVRTLHDHRAAHAAGHGCADSDGNTYPDR